MHNYALEYDSTSDKLHNQDFVFSIFLSSISICIYQENRPNCRIRCIELIFCLFLFKELFWGGGEGVG